MSSAWYPRYPGDYGRDTAPLLLVEHGAFNLLLDHYYATGGPLPKDKAALYRICRASDDAERSAVDSVVNQFFVLRDDGYHNRRADRELAKQAELKDRLSGSGRRGAQKRWGSNGHANSHPNGGASSQAISEANGLSIANPQPQPQEEKKNIPAPKKRVRTSEPPGFIRFWEAYPVGRKLDRTEAFREWRKGGLEMSADQVLAGLSKWTICEQWQDVQFVPHPDKFLRKRRWEAEPPRETASRAEQYRAQRNADALVGKFDPARVIDVTPEATAEVQRMQIENDRWDGLEKGTLLVSEATVTWAREKSERLRKLKLPAQDHRPAQLSSFLKKAREAHPEVI